MVLTKPTLPGWQAPVETDPGSLKTTGYSGESPRSTDHNWLFNRWSEWANYVNLQSNGEYHINAATGNDTTGDGSSGSPWATIDKGLSSLPETGFVNIYLYGAGTDYKTAQDHVINCNVNILNASAQTATFTHGSYVNGTPKNDLYTITLNNCSFNILTNQTTTVEAAQDNAKDWETGAGVFFFSGKSAVTVYSSLDFDDTTVATGGEYYYIQPEQSTINYLSRQTLEFGTFGAILFNTTSCYLFKTANSIAIFNSAATTVDSYSKIISDPVYQNDILYFELITAAGATCSTGADGGAFTLGFGFPTTEAAASNSINYNDNAAAIITAINAITQVPITCKACTVTANTGNILYFEAELYGTAEGEMAPDMTVIASTLTAGATDYDAERWWYKQRARKNPLNLITRNNFSLQRV